VQAGGAGEESNGNGSLMRILPLIFYSKDKPIQERFELTKQVSSVTHGHIRSVMACFYYLEFAKQLIEGNDKFEIYKDLQISMPQFYTEVGIDQTEIAHFDRIFNKDISKLAEDDIQSGGYVIDTLEASLWCLLTTNDFPSAVLKAVNLGRDTDTTAAVTGGLAGLCYSFEAIPSKWVNAVARKGDIEELVERFARSL
jgi:ADP-ribosylglycohydrolase